MKNENELSLPKGLGYKREPVNLCIKKLLDENRILKDEITKLSEVVPKLKEYCINQKKIIAEFEEKSIKEKEMESVREHQISEMLSTAKRKAEQIIWDAEIQAKNTNQVSSELLSNAKKQADNTEENAREIIRQAEVEAQRIISDARAEADLFIKNTVERINGTQAAFEQIQKLAGASKQYLYQMFREIDEYTLDQLSNFDTVKNELPFYIEP